MIIPVKTKNNKLPIQKLESNILYDTKLKTANSTRINEILPTL